MIPRKQKPLQAIAHLGGFALTRDAEPMPFAPVGQVDTSLPSAMEQMRIRSRDAQRERNHKEHAEAEAILFKMHELKELMKHVELGGAAGMLKSILG